MNQLYIILVMVLKYFLKADKFTQFYNFKLMKLL